MPITVGEYGLAPTVLKQCRCSMRTRHNCGMRSKLAILTLLATTAIAIPQQPTGAASLLGKKAPELQVDQWLNSGGKPLTLSSLKGKVVVLDIWAYW